MIIMLAGVAIGVKNAAAEATQRLIRTGRAERSSWAAADTAIGIMIRAVAVLLISWPKMTVTMNMATSRAYGPASATAPTITPATRSPAPELLIAVDIGSIPATSSTVVQGIRR